MRLPLVILSSILVLGSWSLGAEPQEAADLGAMLTRLETGAVTEADLIRFESASRDAAGRGVALDVPRMLRIVDDADLPYQVRAVSLRVVARAGQRSQEGLRELAQRASGWVESAARGPEPPYPDGEHSTHVGFVSTFWTALQSYPLSTIQGVPEAIQFIVTLAGSKQSAIEPNVPRQAVDLLISLNLPVETASNHAVSILRSCDSTSLRDAASLGSLILPEHREALRAMVRGAGDDFASIPWACVYALAHVGDAWIAEECARRAARVPAAGWDPTTTRVMVGHFNQAITMVRAQSEEHGLLGLVKTLPMRDQELRRWALDRAVEVGEDSVRIRAAVLDFAESALAALRSVKDERLRSWETSSTLYWIKEWGQSKGILRADDLRSVEPHPMSGKLMP